MKDSKESLFDILFFIFFTVPFGMAALVTLLGAFLESWSIETSLKVFVEFFKYMVSHIFLGLLGVALLIVVLSAIIYGLFLAFKYARTKIKCFKKVS